MQCGIKLLVKDNRVVASSRGRSFPTIRAGFARRACSVFAEQSPRPPPASARARRGRRISPDRLGEGDGAQRRRRFSASRRNTGRTPLRCSRACRLRTRKATSPASSPASRAEDAQSRLQRPPLHVSAGAGNKKAFGLDRTSNTYADLAHAEVVMVCGSNVSETFPTLIHWIWQARDNGAKLIVVDPRLTPVARTADLHLPVRRDATPRLRRDPPPAREARLARPRLHREPHGGLRGGRRGGEGLRSRLGRERDRHSEAKDHARRGVVGAGGHELPGCTRAASSTTRKASRTSPRASISCSRRDHRPAILRLRHDHRAGQRPGGREHGHKCDHSPAIATSRISSNRRYISEVWGIDEKDLPSKDSTAYEIIQAIHRGEIKGLLSICFNPLVSLPNSNFGREALEKLEFYGAIEFFLSETARHADIVLAGSLQEERKAP